MADETWVDASSDNWDEVVLGSDSLVVVDFWAPWCPYCRQLLPIFEELSEEYQDRARFVKLNAEDAPEIAAKYGVTSIPVLKFFCAGREVYELLGYMPKDELKEELDKVLRVNKTCLNQSSPLDRDPMFA